MMESVPDSLTLDGGMGMEIYRILREERQEVVPAGLSQSLVEARLRDKILFKQIHKAFLEHGADVILTNTYKPTIETLMSYLKISREECENQFCQAAEAAIEIRDEFWDKIQKTGTARRRPLVAASQCSYGGRAFCNDEYIGVHVRTASVEKLVEAHRPKIRIMIEAGVDILAFETVPVADEGKAVAQLMKEFPGSKAWLSFSCKDGKHTCHGEPFRDAAMTSLLSDQIVAVGVNCTNPKYVTSLLQEIPEDVKRKKKIVVYPNNGQKWEYSDRSWYGKMSPPLHEYVAEWVANGADWIGGCCNVTPQHISEIRQVMEKLGKYDIK